MKFDILSTLSDIVSALRSLRQFENSSNASTPAGFSHSSVALGARSHGDSSEEFSHAKAPRADFDFCLLPFDLN